MHWWIISNELFVGAMGACISHAQGGTTTIQWLEACLPMACACLKPPNSMGEQTSHHILWWEVSLVDGDGFRDS